MSKSTQHSRKNNHLITGTVIIFCLLLSLFSLIGCRQDQSSGALPSSPLQNTTSTTASATTPSATSVTSPTSVSLPRGQPDLIGLPPLTAVIGQPVSLLAGVHASDRVDGDLKEQIQINGTVDWLTPGTYELQYSVSNSADLQRSAVRMVTVYDPYAALRTSNQIDASPDPDIQKLLSLTLDRLGPLTNQIGLVYEELDSGRFFTINSQRQFRSASTAKLFVVMAMFADVAAGRLDIDQAVYYTQADYEGGSGILQEMDLSQSYSLGTLADYAIRYSDNIAFHMIKRTVGRDHVYEYYESIIGHPTNRTQTEMSASDARFLLRHLYQSDNPWFPHMLDVMRNTIYKQAIPSLLPPGTVSNKIGFYADYFHDAAIVHNPRGPYNDPLGPYILTIFSKGIETEAGQDPAGLLAELSLMINRQR